jgi:spore coat protein U-like protein
MRDILGVLVKSASWQREHSLQFSGQAVPCFKLFHIRAISLGATTRFDSGTQMKTWLRPATGWVVPILVEAGLALLAPSCWAASETGQLAVSASIPAQCAVGDAALAMGPITVVSANGTITSVSGGAAAAIPWGCTNGTSATLAFGTGSNSTGTDRRMMSTTAGAAPQYLEYQLKAGSQGGAVIGTTPVTLDGADGTNRTFTVWGGPVNSAANTTLRPAGDYSDSVLLTITFAP